MSSTKSKLALLGGPPVRPQGPPNWPIVDQDVLHALQAAYADGSWGKYHGGWVEKLEAQLTSYFHVSHALTCGSGTFAVELALRALRIGPGDEVLLAAYDYPGNFLCIHTIGATPVLVDVHPDDWNLDPGRIVEAIGPATRALIVSHLHGGLVPMTEVMAIAQNHGLSVIEDAAQASGAVVEGRKAGSWGDVGILSFGGSKLLTAGRGGALLTSRADVLQRARTSLHRGNVVCPLSELQAAVLLPQIDKLEARNRHRAANVQHLIELLDGIPGLRPFTNRTSSSQAAYYKMGFQYDAQAFGLARARFVAAMRAEGIALDEGFAGLHVGRSASRFRVGSTLSQAGRTHEGSVVLHHPVLLGSRMEVEEIAQAVRKIFGDVDKLR